MFEAVADILIALANGALSIVSGVFTLRTILLAIVVLSFAWLAAVDLEALDRRAYKPNVRAH